MILTKYRFELTNPLERLLDKDQVTSINNDLKYAIRYLNILLIRLNKEIEDKVKEDEALTDYSNINWALLKAERLGYRRALRKIIELIGPIKND